MPDSFDENLTDVTDVENIILALFCHNAQAFRSGQDTVFFLGPEAIARAAGCPIVYVAVERLRRGHYRVSMDPLVGHDEDLPEGAMIDRYAARTEAQIRAHPSDWLWAYRRWKVRRRPEPDPAHQREPG